MIWKGIRWCRTLAGWGDSEILPTLNCGNHQRGSVAKIPHTLPPMDPANPLLAPPPDIQPPSWLKGEALTQWNLIAPPLINSHMLCQAEVPLLVQLCVLVAKFDRLKGNLSPVEMTNMRSLIRTFVGIGPAQRARLRKVAEKPVSAAKANRYFNNTPQTNDPVVTPIFAKKTARKASGGQG